MKKKKLIKVTGGMPVINENAAGVDAGSKSHFIAISDGKDGHEVYEFETFTEDLREAVELLKSKGITTVAIESTGVYWLNFYLMLEEAGIDPYLVNAKHVKNVTGRKKDDSDAIWLQKLHRCGLLQKSFQPDSLTRQLRTLVRHRDTLLRMSTEATQRMQKTLELMNIKIHSIIRYITGKTGLAVVKAILEGERNPAAFLKYKDPGIKCSDEEFKKSIDGFWSDENLFLLKQEYDTYLFIRGQLEECDKMICEQLVQQVAKVREGDLSDVSVKWRKNVKKNELPFNAEPLLKIIFGVNLCNIEGVGELTALKILSELGNDFSKWGDVSKFTAWLNVSPNTKITGGKIIKSRIERKTNIAGQGIRQAASTISRCKGPMGDYARSLKKRIGKKPGSIAMAHKLARIMYVMVRDQKEYNPDLIKQQMDQNNKSKIKFLEKKLARLKMAS